MTPTSPNRRSALVGAGAALVAGAGGVLIGRSTTGEDAVTTSAAASATGTTSSSAGTSANQPIFGTSTASPARTRTQLTDGLFVLSGIIGYGQATVLVDNDGTQRGEIVTTAQTAAQVPIPVGGRILTTVGPSALGVIQPTGFLWRIIDLGRYTVHHDVHAVGDTAYVLATDSSSDRTTVQDVVLVVDVPTGEITRVIDMIKVLPKYLETTHAREGQDKNDWLHLNSVDVVDDTVYLSSRETSTIIALDGATGAGTGTGTPTIRYLIGASNIWEGTGYESKFLTKTTNFSENAGQHSLRRLDAPSLADGQYYLEMFNNNLWYMGTRDDVSKMGPANASTSETTGTSEILRYLVDENEGTVAEAARVDVPYSSVMSDALRIRSDDERDTDDGTLSDHLVVCSAKARVFSERTSVGEVIAQYRADSPTGVYRVYKDSFTGYWYE